MKKILIITLLFTCSMFLAGCTKYENSATCIREHQETRHHDAWTQFIFSGKVMMPIYHPAYDYEVIICDQWR